MSRDELRDFIDKTGNKPVLEIGPFINPFLKKKDPAIIDDLQKRKKEIIRIAGLAETVKKQTLLSNDISSHLPDKKERKCRPFRLLKRGLNSLKTNGFADTWKRSMKYFRK